MPRTSESFDKDIAALAADTDSALNDAVRPLRKAGALVANDFADQVEVGSLAVDTTTGDVYSCTATNGTTTSSWELVGLQA